MQDGLPDIDVEARAPAPINGGPAVWSIWASLVKGAWIIALAVAISLGISILYLHQVTYKYDVIFTITPVPEQASSAPRSLSGFASLAGLNLPTESGSVSFDLYLEALKSRPAADRLAQDSRIMKRVFAKEWSAEHGRWEKPSSLRLSIRDGVMNILGVPGPRWAPPSGARLQEFLEDEIDIVKDKESPLVTVKLRSADPEVAETLLWRLHLISDSILRNRALERSNAYSRYLNTRLATVTVSEYREAMVASLATQERMHMMASANVPFVADPFGKPVTTLKPRSPNPVGITLFFALAGLLVGGFVAVNYDRRKGKR